MSLGSLKNVWDTASNLGSKAVEGLSNIASKAREHIGHAISGGADYLHAAADIAGHIQPGLDAVAPSFLSKGYHHLVHGAHIAAPVIKGIGNLIGSKDFNAAKENAEKLSGRLKDWQVGKPVPYVS